MGTVNINGQEIEYNDDYSFCDFSNQDLAHFPDLKDITIYSSQFYWEKPNSIPFAEYSTGITFVKCNLDNVIVPPRSILISSSNRKFKNQNDGEDWFLDDNGSPMFPINRQLYISLGLSINPLDIPARPMGESILMLTMAGEG